MTARFITPPELLKPPSVRTRTEFTPDSPLPFPLVLQSRAGRVVRQHVLRGVTRGIILLATDLCVLSGLRLVKKGVRDHGWLGPEAGRVASELVPAGSYPTPQLLAAMILSLILFGNYGQGDHRRDPRRIMLATVLGFGLMFWSRLWTDFEVIQVVGFGLTVVIAGAILILGRRAVDIGARHARPDRQIARTLVIGPEEAARQTLRYPPLRRRSDFHMVGYLSTETSLAEDALGSIDSLIAVMEERHIDTVILSGAVSDDVFSAVVDAAASAGCQVFSLPRYFHGNMLEPRLVWYRSVPLIQLSRPSLRWQQLVLKRMVDVVGSTVGLLLCAPLFLAIAAAIKLTSPGPVLFRQPRPGQGGRYFNMWKFRSMVPNAAAREAEFSSIDGRLFKVTDDPRITRIGGFLRRTSLDELPQLWNVLRGDMSLVGPRPPLEREVALYEEHHYAKFEMKPGITGPWQVSGRSSITSFDEVRRIETAYMRQWSIWLDVAILLRTIPTVLVGRGAV